MNAKKLEALVESLVGADLKKAITKESVFREAVPAAILLNKAAKDAFVWARMVAEKAKAVSDAAAAYAIDHPKAMDEPVSAERNGVQTGFVKINGEEYHLSVSKDKPERINGANMIQEFLEKLPVGWTKPRAGIEPDKEYLQTLSDSELAKKGIYLPLKFTWRLSE